MIDPTSSAQLDIATRVGQLFARQTQSLRETTALLDPGLVGSPDSCSTE